MLTYYSNPAVATPPVALKADVCVYGATSGGIVAACQAAKAGLSVVLLAFNDRIGGMTTSGLGSTDIGNKRAIGGAARKFYQALGSHYGTEEAWRFEPHVAEAEFRRMLSDAGVTVRYWQRLSTAEKHNGALTQIAMEDGSSYCAKVFIDASYEGDLMAAAGVAFRIGREGAREYGEIYNGVHVGSPYHNFSRFVDPYRISGKPSSGLLPGISDESAGVQGTADASVQAFNFRLCLTDRDDNRVPFPEPVKYDPERYTLLARYLDTGVWDALTKRNPVLNGKTDTNNNGAFSTDYIGGSHRWPHAGYAEREAIFQEHVEYTQGLLWFLSVDERVPQAIREEMSAWGFAADEFAATGGFSPELYIREGRRMLSDYVMTEQDCLGQRHCGDPVALAAYTMDSHNCRRVVYNGRVLNEGNVEIGGFAPYGISYRSLVPRESDCVNLMVPFALSASHIAFGSIRMEPVFMALGETCALAAALAIAGQCPLQKISYPELRAKLLDAGQVLHW